MKFQWYFGEEVTDSSGKVWNCRLTADGLTFLIGQNALLIVEVDLKAEAKLVATLPQLMEELIVMEMILKLKIATVTLVRLTVVGLISQIGLNAPLHVTEDLKAEAEHVATLLRQTEELTATEMILKPRTAILTPVQVRWT